MDWLDPTWCACAHDMLNWLISWSPRLCFCGRCRNLQFMSTTTKVPEVLNICHNHDSQKWIKLQKIYQVTRILFMQCHCSAFALSMVLHGNNSSISYNFSAFIGSQI